MDKKQQQQGGNYRPSARTIKLIRIGGLALLIASSFMFWANYKVDEEGADHNASFSENPEIAVGSFSDGIPRIIHQSWKSAEFDDPILTNASASWKAKNPDFQYMLWTDEQCESFVKKEFPDVYPQFSRLPKIVHKVDFFRYMVLFKYGGVYTDADTICLRAVDTWNNNMASVQAIIGIEQDASGGWEWWKVIARQLQFTQWTIAAAPGFEVLGTVISMVNQTIANATNEELAGANVLNLTGPGPFTDAVYKYLEKRSRKWQEFQSMTTATLVDGLYILPITGFSPENKGMFAKGINHHDACVQHLFLGSWRESEPYAHGSVNKDKTNKTPKSLNK
ncbi:nucleotide-diphospho-sugar transferase [Chytridium lagenaria]|nr:nucleotide-diphospho-sugar transferase [Chytridium lagenaria]